MLARFDICEAYHILEHDYGQGGWLRERGFRSDGTVKQVSVQLKCIGFRPSPLLNGYDDLTDEGKLIYDRWVTSHGFGELS